MEAWLPVIVALLGVASTLVAWFFNPKRKIQAEIDDIAYKLEVLYAQRDAALEKNDSDNLTIFTSAINKLHTRQNILLRR